MAAEVLVEKGSQAAASTDTERERNASPGSVSARSRERHALTPLDAQVHELRRELAQARTAIARFAQYAPELSDGVAERFAGLLADAEALIPSVDRHAALRSTPKAEWESVVKARERCTALSAEALACLEGALLRHEQLDSGVCAIADRLLKGLDDRTGVSWKRLTILGDGESYGQFGEIVRIRPSVWQLPVAVHEFGHFVGPRISVETFEEGLADARQPFAEILRDKRADDSVRAFHVHEYFADMFATWAAGPAYAYVFIVLRFDPSNARSQPGLHPSRLRRLAVILKTLQAMDDLGGLAVSYKRVMEDLTERSRASRAAVDDERPALTPKSVGEVDAVFAELRPLLDRVERARYGRYSAAESLAERLPPGRALPSVDGLSILDVLNAAWRWRVDSGESDPGLIDAVGKRVQSLCESAAA